MEQPEQPPEPDALPFKTLVDFFEAVSRAKGKRKQAQLEKLWKTHRRDPDDPRGALFELFRLLVPHRDRTRGNYGLKEKALAAVLCKAVLLDPKTSAAAKRAMNWKKPQPEQDDLAGNFPAVMEKYLFSNSCTVDPSDKEAQKALTVAGVNAALDSLAAAGGQEAKALVVQGLLGRTTPRMLAWFVRIVLKDLKLGMGEASILRAYHPDAEALFNHCMDLRRVVLELRDRGHRIPSADVEPGRPVRPQLALARASVQAVHQKMGGQPFVIDTKFDGERIQLHRVGGAVSYFTRRGLDHGADYAYSRFDPVVAAQLREDPCVLDGEIVAWNRRTQAFIPFGSNKTAFGLAGMGSPAEGPARWGHGSQQGSDGEGEQAQEQQQQQAAPEQARDVVIYYVAFDVLFAGGQAVINRPLQERQALLNRLVSPPGEGTPLGDSGVAGKIAVLTPQRPTIEGALCCREGRSEADIQQAYDDAVRVQEEGIVVKALDSHWTANERSSGAWLKLKPDYAAASEIDAVVIGGSYGSGHRGGLLSEYVVGLADTRSGGGRPRAFLSFCRVSTGLCDADRQRLHTHLETTAGLLEAAKGRQRSNAPACYRTTGREDVDVWVRDPYKSVVLQLKADVRFIPSGNFKTALSLRFPRIERLRWDKGARDIASEAELHEALADKRHSDAGGGERGPKRKRAGGRRAAPLGIAHPAFAVADVSRVQPTSDRLAGQAVAVLHAPAFPPAGQERRGRQAVCELIARMGGTAHARPLQGTAFCVTDSADPCHGRLREAWALDKDVLCLDWLLRLADCAQPASQAVRTPADYVYVSRATRHTRAGMDEWGDLHAVDSSPTDVRALLTRHMAVRLPGGVALSAAEALKRPPLPAADPQSLAPSGWAGEFTASDAAQQLERQLEAGGLPKPLSSLFRGAEVCLLLPGPAASPPPRSLEGRLLTCQATLAGNTVRMGGGRLASAVTPHTTHLALLPAAAAAGASPEQLLRLVAAQAGGAAGVCELRARLLAAQLSIVPSQWLLQLWQEASERGSASGVSAAPAQAQLHALQQPGAPPPEQWPWEEHGWQPPPPPKAGKRRAAPKAAARAAGSAAPRAKRSRGKLQFGPLDGQEAGPAGGSQQPPAAAAAAEDSDPGSARKRPRRSTRQAGEQLLQPLSPPWEPSLTGATASQASQLQQQPQQQQQQPTAPAAAPAAAGAPAPKPEGRSSLLAALLGDSDSEGEAPAPARTAAAPQPAPLPATAALGSPPASSLPGSGPPSESPLARLRRGSSLAPLSPIGLSSSLPPAAASAGSPAQQQEQPRAQPAREAAAAAAAAPAGAAEGDGDRLTAAEFAALPLRERVRRLASGQGMLRHA